jgi:hypothetical protein
VKDSKKEGEMLNIRSVTDKTRLFPQKSRQRFPRRNILLFWYF